MDLKKQQDIMLRFAHCKYKHGSNTHEEADCAGAGQLILRDYAGLYLPEDRTSWATYFEILQWPCELKDWDVLLMQHGNTLELIDHMAVHIGDKYLVTLTIESGLICQRLDKYNSKILKVARFKR